MLDVWKPHATVAAIIERDNRFLMVEEIADGKTVYNQPAGHLEPGESLLDASIRETMEESAWCFTPEYISGIYRWDHQDTQQCYLRVAFVGSCSQHNAKLPLDDGIIRALWLSRNELVSDPEKLRSPLVLRCIDDYLQGKKYPLQLLTDI
jgi:8-oxo-dGTP pyrophosphatase MutT (NUDIX family)